MKGAPLLVLPFLLAAAGARAQSYGRETPWSGDENMSEASTLPSGNVQGARPLRIRTAKPACFVAAGFPVVRALIEPYETVESARVFFRPEAYPLWYQVPMVRSGQGFLAALPKPRPSAQRVHYFVEATAPGHPRARGQEHVVAVVEAPSDCAGPPGETAETASIAIRVPKGAPTTPPVPPGFVPVGAVNLEDPRGSKSRLPLVIAGGFAALAAGTLALPGAENNLPVEPAGDTIAFLESVPPPDSRFSLRSPPTLTVRMRVRTQREIGPGTMRVVLYRSFANGGASQPCAVLQAPHGGFAANAPQEIQISGPLQLAQVCQPADRMRLSVEENGRAVLSTGATQPDYPARFFIDP